MFPVSRQNGLEEPLIFFEQDDLLEDLLADCNNPNNEKVVAKRQREVEGNKDCSSSSSLKKTSHRFSEKQRRKEMKALFASLRSLLPLQYIKGKRAISDHMEQAVNYINDTKKNIEELKTKRDKLKKLCNKSSNAENHNMSTSKPSSRRVEINLCRDGLMEILISSTIDKDNFDLSKVLHDLLSRQLNVVNCVSSRGSRVCLHKIQIELDDPTSIDLSELQEGLENVIMLA